MRKTKDSEGLGTPLKPLMISEFSKVIGFDPVYREREEGYYSLEEVSEQLGICTGTAAKLMRNNPQISRRRFKLNGMKKPEYYYKIIK